MGTHLMLTRNFLAIAALSLTAQAQIIHVKPYVQPGDGATLEGTDSKVLTWLTDQVPGDFKVEFAPAGQPMITVRADRLAMDFARGKTPLKPAASAKTPSLSVEDLKEEIAKSTSPSIPEVEQHFFRYRSTLSNLPFDTEVSYRVSLAGAVVREGKFQTRASATKPIRFVAVGDLASGKAEQNAIAYQISKVAPQFLVALGDIVYSRGRVSQYQDHFWTTYNDVANAGPKTGAPLMASIPFYPVIGNHDADSVKLSDYPDAFAAYYFFSVPKNGPGTGPWNTPLGANVALANAFRTRAGTEYPAVGIYSFDYGPGHFVSLDSNSYLNPAAVRGWLEKDLLATKQPWKFVCFHAPAFHTSPQHYSEQKMRLLQPTFENCGVDVVFNGHVHNYQRSRPLHFSPNPPERDRRGRVNGKFTFDMEFDGVGKTKPNGVIHVVSGGGGASLYKTDFESTVAKVTAETPENYQPLTAKFIADQHSFSVVELTPSTFVLRQVSIEGKQLDEFKITK